MRICEDEIFGVLSVAEESYSLRRTVGHQSTFWPIETYLSWKDKCNRPIVIVNESPHIKEFEGVNIKNAQTNETVNARPVNGATGYNLLQQLDHLLKQLPAKLADGNYPVLVINAIQLQCSRGVDTLIHRTRDFIHYWPTYQSRLFERLSALNPSLVINACTKGDFYIKNDNGQLENSKAYNSGFDSNFKRLLNNEFGYRQVDSGGVLQFMGTFDLSGLVMYQLHHVYQNSDIAIYKTTHPSSWGFREPRFSNYSNKIYEFARV